MRGAFLEDIGLTALNLVEQCCMCHNDIRLPNIAFRDGSFCLLDFDMLDHGVEFQRESASTPTMWSSVYWNSHSAQMMCYSVAQIAANEFALDSPD